MSGAFNAAVLALAWFAAVNACTSVAVWAGATAWGHRVHNARALLALRLAPASASILFVGLVFVPSHWRFEPRGVEESFGWTTYLIAAAGSVILLRSLLRAGAVARAGWALRACAALPRIGVPVAGRTEVYEVAGMTGVSLAGVVRPRILVGPAIRHALTRAEFEAAVAHETAHRASRDNVKRFAMFCAPDLFGMSAAALILEEKWRAASEWQADAAAVAGDQARAVDLASALVKVARIASAGQSLGSPAWSTLHDAPLLETRVHRLLTGDAPEAARSRSIAAALALAMLVGAAATLGITGGAAVHALTEVMARW